VEENRTICSSRSRRPVRKLSNTLSYTIVSHSVIHMSQVMMKLH